MKNKALFLDRDGVINKEINYLFKIKKFQFNKGIFKVCNYFIEKGFIIIVITNQAGIARGFYNESDFEKITLWMHNEFRKRNIKIEKTYHCPHHPEFTQQNCNCRKPQPGMIFQAKAEYNIDLKSSFLIGDKISDIQSGINAGIINNIKIRTNKISDVYLSDEFNSLVM